MCVCVSDFSWYWARFPICFVQPCCCLSFCGCTFAADRTAQSSYASTSNKFPLQRIKDCGDCVWQRLHCQRVEEFMQLPKNCRLKCMLMCCTNMYISLSLSHSLWHMLSFCGFCVINSILYVSYIKFVFVVYSILLLFWLITGHIYGTKSLSFIRFQLLNKQVDLLLSLWNTTFLWCLPFKSYHLCFIWLYNLNIIAWYCLENEQLSIYALHISL